ncbi:hypothetical protein IWQ61_002931 [Dispira simplex]|nr:hypothetical protein IWQ61_002931 [Dispira simplex]
MFSLQNLCATSVVAIFFGSELVSSSLSGSGTITPHNYVDMGTYALTNNPPSCGMPYASLDITRITAIQTMDKSSECGKCIKVTNGDDPLKFIHVLAVDTGGRGLDVSTVAYKELFGQDTDPAPASWEPADDSDCSGIWSNGSSPKEDDTTAAPTSSPPTKPTLGNSASAYVRPITNSGGGQDVIDNSSQSTVNTTDSSGTTNVNESDPTVAQGTTSHSPNYKPSTSSESSTPFKDSDTEGPLARLNTGGSTSMIFRASSLIIGSSLTFLTAGFLTLHS